MLPPDALEARIARMQALIGAGQDTGYYPRSLLTTGLRQDDPEYEGKYTILRQPGRQARPPVSRDPVHGGIERTVTHDATLPAG